MLLISAPLSPPHLLHRSFEPRMAVKVGVDISQVMEECILAAASEDEVRVCMEVADEMEATTELEPDAPTTALEQCILASQNEDEVQACMQASEEEVNIDGLSLGDCLKVGEVDECVLASDQANENSYG